MREKVVHTKAPAKQLLSLSVFPTLRRSFYIFLGGSFLDCQRLAKDKKTCILKPQPDGKDN